MMFFHLGRLILLLAIFSACSLPAAHAFIGSSNGGPAERGGAGMDRGGGAEATPPPGRSSAPVIPGGLHLGEREAYRALYISETHVIQARELAKLRIYRRLGKDAGDRFVEDFDNAETPDEKRDVLDRLRQGINIGGGVFGNEREDVQEIETFIDQIESLLDAEEGLREGLDSLEEASQRRGGS